MASVPPTSLGGGGRIGQFLQANKKSFLIYSLFCLLLIEVVSIFIRYNENYVQYWYPLLTQIGFFLLVFSLFLWRERLHFCYRKNVAVFVLALYYLFGAFSIVAQVSDKAYTSIISYSLLGLCGLIFILSFIKSND